MDQHRRPNLLIIHTDQLSCWALSCYSDSLIQTTNIDSLASRGTVFYNFFTNSAVCTPSRGCFVTGRYPESHGAHTNNIPINRDEITFAEVLKGHGYKTGYAGKWHLDGTPRPGWVHPERSMGFDDCYYMFNRGHWKKIEDAPMPDMQPIAYPYQVMGDEATYTSDWLTGKAISFIERNRDQAFCYMVSYPDPHGPIRVRPPYNTLVSPEDVVLPKSFYPDWLPQWAIKLQDRSPFGLNKPERETALRTFIASYLGEVKLLDDCVGRIVSHLTMLGLMEDTIIVFTTDHGEYGGEHGLFGKNHLYETAYRIPMIIHWPKGLPGPRRIHNVASTVDFQPTILGLLGIRSSGREQGRDASSLLHGRETRWTDVAYLHHNRQHAAGIFTKEYQLVLFEEEESVLFDRLNDPVQTRNIIAEPTQRETVLNLARLVAEHHHALNTPASSWLKQYLD